MATTYNINISVVVPLYNEEESLPELHAWIRRVMEANNYTYEIIFVDDGSSDNSWNIVRSLQRRDANIRGIRFRRNYGKSAALYCGFEAARGEVVITMDADLQDSPDEIPELYRMIKLERYDLVSGWKKRRHDPLGKTLPSKFFNFCARLASGIKLHDFNCGLKAYRNKVIKSIEVYGEMHRFIPLLAKSAGFRNIGEKVVHHRARKYGKSKFGWERMIKGYLDLITVMFMSKFGKSPMYFFGGLGTLMFLVGGGTTIALIAEKLYKQAHMLPIRGVTEQPLFFIAITAVIIGVQLFLAGFIGELINRNSGERNRYLIDERLEPTPDNTSENNSFSRANQINNGPKNRDNHSAPASLKARSASEITNEEPQGSRPSRNRSRRGKFDKNRGTASASNDTQQPKEETTEYNKNQTNRDQRTEVPAKNVNQIDENAFSSSASHDNLNSAETAPTAFSVASSATTVEANKLEQTATTTATGKDPSTTAAKQATVSEFSTKPAAPKEAPITESSENNAATTANRPTANNRSAVSSANHKARTTQPIDSSKTSAAQNESSAKSQPAAPAERDLFSM